MTEINAHSFVFETLNKERLNLKEYQDKVMLIVNTASHCGLTPQYKELQGLYEKYKEKGLVIIAVPSGSFGGQEFASEKDVKSFIQDKYNITFPVTSIEVVKGKGAHPFYLWANKKSGVFGGPKWNFHKYIIGKNGNFVGGFSSTTSPASTKIENVLKEELKK